MLFALKPSFYIHHLSSSISEIMKASGVKTPRPGIGHLYRTPHTPQMRTPMGIRTGNKVQVPIRQISKEDIVRDPVEVFCRVRPREEEDVCLKVMDETSVQLAPPASSKSYNSGKETKCSFKCKNPLNLLRLNLVIA